MDEQNENKIGKRIMAGEKRKLNDEQNSEEMKKLHKTSNMNAGNGKGEEKLTKLQQIVQHKKVDEKRVPNWLIEVLAWIKRTEMANSPLSISCLVFKQLCWPKLHGNVRPYTVKKLLMGSNHPTGLIREDAFGVQVNIPIAAIPPPKYIIGFSDISIFFLDGRIVKFIECICPLLNGECWLYDVKRNEMPEVPIYSIIHERSGQVKRFFEMFFKKEFKIIYSHFGTFLRFYPNANDVLGDVQSIDTNIEEWDVNLFVKWLTESRIDKQPKLLEDLSVIAENKFKLIDQIKEEFSHTIKPANFLIKLRFEPTYPDFVMKNGQTKEVLALYANPNQNLHSCQYLVRHPKNSEHLKSEWEKLINLDDNKMPCIHVEICEIGEL